MTYLKRFATALGGPTGGYSVGSSQTGIILMVVPSASLSPYVSIASYLVCSIPLPFGRILLSFTRGSPSALGDIVVIGYASSYYRLRL